MYTSILAYTMLMIQLVGFDVFHRFALVNSISLIKIPFA